MKFEKIISVEAENTTELAAKLKVELSSLREDMLAAITPSITLDGLRAYFPAIPWMASETGYKSTEDFLNLKITSGMCEIYVSTSIPGVGFTQREPIPGVDLCMYKMLKWEILKRLHSSRESKVATIRDLEQDLVKIDNLISALAKR